MNPDPNRLLSREEVEAQLGLSKRFLEVAAVRGDGPPMTKLRRSVRYRYCDILTWLDAHKVGSTSARRGP
jgi:predicted DNA-binding transcriptional regulator AlpA